MRDSRFFVILIVIVCLLGGCDTFFQEEAPPSSSSRTQAPKIRVTGGTSSRGADLEPVSGEGQLVEPDETSSQPTAEVPTDTPLRWDLHLLPYRAMLDAGEQTAYDEIYGQLINLNHYFKLRSDISVQRIDDVIHAVLYDNPELFWVDSRYRYSYTSDGRINDVTVTFNTLSTDIETARQKFETAAAALVSAAREMPTDYEKAKLVHDAIVAEVDYQLGAAHNQSAYSALVTKRSVCAGYSRAFQYVMMELGIPCYYCVGYAQEDHAWNIIRLGDGYYNVDLSWDDPVGSSSGEVHYEYYNITDEKLFYDHRREELSINLPPCDATEYSYNQTFGKDTPVKEGGEPQDYRELGYSDADVIETLEEYYAESYRALSENGVGVLECSMVLKNEILREQVYTVISNQAWFKSIAAPAAEDWELKGYTAEIGVTSEALQGGYFLLTQKITLNAVS